MNPRDSMPTTWSIPLGFHRVTSSSITRRYTAPSPRTGVMSLKTIPFLGKSWTSRMVRRSRSEIDSMGADSTSGQEGNGVARLGPLADLEVQVRTGGAPGLADLGDGRAG